MRMGKVALIDVYGTVVCYMYVFLGIFCKYWGIARAVLHRYLGIIAFHLTG